MMFQTILLLLLTSSIHAFLTPSAKLQSYTTKFRSTPSSEGEDLADLDTFLKTNYSNFYSIISKNEELWKVLKESKSAGFTVFAPNDTAFVSKLDAKQQSQLQDPRNKETSDKLGLYHVVNEAVTAEELFASGGIITAGGEVPVGRSTSGGFFGFGGKEDGGVSINGAKVVQTVKIGENGGLVHEVDDLISPRILWRYMDQLRIPGSS